MFAVPASVLALVASLETLLSIEAVDDWIPIGASHLLIAD